MSEVLQLNQVSFSCGNERLLAPVSLQLNAGQQVLLTGPSGSGKSTLLKIIASLLPASSGQVLFHGTDIEQLAPDQYRRQVAYCFQTPALFGETVFDNLALPYTLRSMKPDRQAMGRWLDRVMLAGTLLDHPIHQLSGGERQRIGLLRNLQFLPEVLLLDEVTSALDEANKQNILTLIDELLDQQLAVLTVSHDAEQIAQARQRIMLAPPEQSSIRVSNSESDHGSA